MQRARCSYVQENVVSKVKKSVFRVARAVKANARERVGMPPPAVVLPDDKARAERRTSKHKVTLEKLLRRESER